MSELEQYLTDDEKKEIALRVFEQKLSYSFSKNEAERLVTNMAYGVAEKLVSQNIGKEFEAAIKSKLPEIISELSTFVVFSPGNDYGAFKKEPTAAWKVVDSWVRNNNALIEDRVSAIVNGIDEETLRQEISEAIYKAVVEPTLSKG